MASNNYLVLGHYIICVGCLCFILYSSAVMLFKKSKKNNGNTVARTPTVYVYFWFTATSSILLLINAAYILIFWRPDEVIYNPMVLYFIAGIPTIYVNFVPIADFYLCLDRCFLIAFPIKYRQTQQKYTALIFIGTIFAIFVTYFLATKYFSFYTPETKTSCVFYICLVFQLKYPLIMTYTKYTFCGLNAIAAVILLLLNHFRKNLQKDVAKKLNRSVLLVSIINTAFSFVPALLDDMIFRISAVHPLEILGDYNLTLVCINIAICVFLYYRIFRRHFLEDYVVKTHAVSTITNSHVTKII